MILEYEFSMASLLIAIDEELKTSEIYFLSVLQVNHPKLR